MKTAISSERYPDLGLEKISFTQVQNPLTEDVVWIYDNNSALTPRENEADDATHPESYHRRK